MTNPLDAPLEQVRMSKDGPMQSRQVFRQGRIDGLAKLHTLPVRTDALCRMD